MSLCFMFYLLDDREDVVLAHDHHFLVVDLDLGAGVGGEDDLVALLDVPGGAFAALEALAVAQRDDLAALGLLLGGIGQDDAGLGLGLGLHTLDENFIAEWAKLGHCSY